jgi:hypothetical protein
LVAGVLAKPFEEVGVEAHGDDGFGGGQNDLGVFPECGACDVSFGVGEDALANLVWTSAAEFSPVGSVSGGAARLRSLASSGGVRAAPNAKLR